MKRFIIALFTIVTFSSNSFAQQAYESKLSYNKADQPALVIEYDFPPDIVESALKDKMTSLGLKSKSSKGFLVYSSSTIREISSKQLEYAFKVERKGRKDKDKTILSMIIVGAGDDGDINSNGKYFLSNLTPNIEANSLEVEIKGQEDNVGKSEKKFKTLQDDKTSLEKKIRDLQDDLKTNEKDQENQLKDIEKQRNILEALKARRK